MTPAQKRLFNGLKKHDQRGEFIEMLRAQQARMGGYEDWADAYLQKCLKRAEAPARRRSG